MPKKISANRDYFSRTLHFLCIFFWGDFVCIVQTCVHIFNDLCVCFSPAHQIVISRTYGNRTVLVPHVQTIPQAVMYIYIYTHNITIYHYSHIRAHMILNTRGQGIASSVFMFGLGWNHQVFLYVGKSLRKMIWHKNQMIHEENDILYIYICLYVCMYGWMDGCNVM